jgi:hypothetical protein
VVTPWLGILDGRCVVPAAAAVSEDFCGGGNLGLGLAITSSRQSRPAPDWELVDLGRSLIHTCIDHLDLSWIERTTMVRPTRSLLVTEIAISFAPSRNANCSKKVTGCAFRRHFLFCFV